MTLWSVAALADAMESEPYAETVASTFHNILLFMHENSWTGACHATTAVAFCLLRQQEIVAIPCLGEIAIGSACADHSWIEIDGLIFDAAIAMPLTPSDALPVVMASRDVTTGEATRVRYGVKSRVGFQHDAMLLGQMSLGTYIAGFPGSSDGLWGIIELLGSRMGLPRLSARSRLQLGGQRWALRPPEAHSTEDDRRRERNRRKRLRQKH